jgi:hypothetical protein
MKYIIDDDQLQQIQFGKSIVKLEPIPEVKKWVDRCKVGACYIDMLNAMEAEIKELRLLCAQTSEHNLA